MIRELFRSILTVPSLTAVAALVLAANPVKAAQGPYPSNAALRQIKDIEDPRLSPDGRQILYRIVDSTAEGGQAHLHLLDIEHNHSIQLTTTASTDGLGDHDAVWSHDGGSILFLAKRGTHAITHDFPSRWRITTNADSNSVSD
jgi:Tol biopolymer transport system component